MPQRRRLAKLPSIWRFNAREFFGHGPLSEFWYYRNYSLFIVFYSIRVDGLPVLDPDRLYLELTFLMMFS